MLSLLDPWRASAISLDVIAASRLTRESVRQRQSHRLASLLSSASKRCALYRREVGPDGARLPLDEWPVWHKRDLMRRFDEWVTDPTLRLDVLRRFVADPTAIGAPGPGGCTVWESSGSTGEPALFVQDTQAMAVYDALEAWRRPSLQPLQRFWNPWLVGERLAFVGATSGHFASTVSVERLRRLNTGMASALRGFSFLQPTDLLVQQLEAWKPTIVATYPTAALLLAEEHAAGRLHLPVQEIWTGGEPLTPAVRRYVSEQFGCPVSNSYGASEFLAMASECSNARLHLNIDWLVLESVDRHYRPVPDGEPGDTTLLTNLANHVQPVIRCDLGDRVTVLKEPCGCGSPLPAIEVQGRVDDTLLFSDERGRAVRLLPLALTTVVEDEAGVFDFQLEQQGDRALRLSVACSGEAGEQAVQRGCAALGAYMRKQGLGHVRVDGRCGKPLARGRSGKVPRVVAAA